MNTYKAIFELLCAEQTHREQRKRLVLDPVANFSVPEWVLIERRALLAKVNELRVQSALPLLDEVTFVKKAEWLATGHSDYPTKFALYASELTRSSATLLAV